MLQPEKAPLLRPPGGPVAVNAFDINVTSRVATHNGPGSPRKAAADGSLGVVSTMRSLAAGTAYCVASVSMVLTNKIALSGFNVSSPTGLLLLQCAMCVALVTVCLGTKLIKRQRLSWGVVRTWVPVNLVFVSMVWTSFAALQYLTIPTVTVLKNMANLFTICGDYFLNGRTYSLGIWATLSLMAASAIASGVTDLEYSAVGYAWQIVNCMFTAGYSLYLRRAMDDVRQHTEDRQPLTEMSMVLLNNALSLPVLMLLLVLNGEVFTLISAPELHDPAFVAAAVMSGLVSFGISFASLWFLSTTTPTMYSLVGSLNKVPIALLSIWLFPGPNSTNPQNLASVCIGLSAGVVFVWTKALESQQQQGSTGGMNAAANKQQQP